MGNLNENLTQSTNEKFLPFVIKNGLISGLFIGITSYIFLLFAVRVYPDLFTEYFNPVFNSDGSRDVFYYLHSFILGIGLAVLWYRFRANFKGNFILRGIEFGLLYLVIALIPVMWITFSAINVSVNLILSWTLYGFVQACLAGFVFALLSKKH